MRNMQKQQVLNIMAEVAAEQKAQRLEEERIIQKRKTKVLDILTIFGVILIAILFACTVRVFETGNNFAITYSFFKCVATTTHSNHECKIVESISVHENILALETHKPEPNEEYLVVLERYLSKLFREKEMLEKNNPELKKYYNTVLADSNRVIVEPKQLFIFADE